nr:hypothetical protein [Tanacetum cinerariifolium]
MRQKIINFVTLRLLRPQYCPLCPQAHGFAVWPSCEDFPAGHPYQVKDKQEKDKIRSKPGKNGKRGEAGRNQK